MLQQVESKICLTQCQASAPRKKKCGLGIFANKGYAPSPVLESGPFVLKPGPSVLWIALARMKDPEKNKKDCVNSLIVASQLPPLWEIKFLERSCLMHCRSNGCDDIISKGPKPCWFRMMLESPWSSQSFGQHTNTSSVYDLNDLKPGYH